MSGIMVKVILYSRHRNNASATLTFNRTEKSVPQKNGFFL